MINRRENRRDIWKIVKKNRGHNWGFVIYRTIYTPESDTLWPLIISKLNAYIFKSLWADFDNDNPDMSIGEVPLDSEPCRQACATMKNLVLSNKNEFDNADVGAIGHHFVDFFDKHADLVSDISRIQRSVCLVIDQEVYEAIRDAPLPDPKVEEPYLWIKVVDGEFDPGDLSESPAGYNGWGYCPVSLLALRLYLIVDGNDLTFGHLVSQPDSRQGPGFRFFR